MISSGWQPSSAKVATQPSEVFGFVVFLRACQRSPLWVCLGGVGEWPADFEEGWRGGHEADHQVHPDRYASLGSGARTNSARSRGLLDGCVATFKKRPENACSSRPGFISCNQLEQLVDELNLLPNIRTGQPPLSSFPATQPSRSERGSLACAIRSFGTCNVDMIPLPSTAPTATAAIRATLISDSMVSMRRTF